MLTKIPIELHNAKDCALLQASLWYGILLFPYVSMLNKNTLGVKANQKQHCKCATKNL